MSAGTLTLTNNSAAVAGSGTAFTTEVAAGDFIVVTVGGVPYTLPVKSVESGTALTLVSNFTGPTQSGAAWSVVPRVALNMVTAAMVVQNTEALRGLNYDKQNWQLIFSSSGDVTVKLPDGSSFTGPAWGGIAATLSSINQALTGLSQELNKKLSKNANLSDLTDASAARNALSLGSAAMRDATSAPAGTAVMSKYPEDMRGINSYAVPNAYPMGITAGIHTGKILGLPADRAIGLINLRPWPDDSAAEMNFQLFSYSNNGVPSCGIVVPKYAPVGNAWYYEAPAYFWHTRNTVIDSNGFLKRSSPVMKLFSDGTSECTTEAEGCVSERIDTGQYLISGCMGLNADAAWGGVDGGFEIPVDRNKQPRIWLDYKVNADGSVQVRTYHRVHPSAPPFAQNRIGNTDIDGVFTETVADSEPVDIPADSFVSVRVEMPEDSIWNRMQKETREATEKAERERQQNQQDTQS
ncbi:phage tail protein [Citrobacter freundii]|uniref:phage tail fiber protein n=1 Tax=Citrobacter freundii TaxID=546 RepID=UPI000C80C43B|nr:phage tail protein [Citrobacter freundii]DAO58493.1 MAG TPA: tail protein [Caudoviricetes sp.]PMD01311.1 phage tail protein [Citrobacter freundii]WLV36701.1 phage tail protein [Citrobacter freundii]HCJ7432663.1 phage tail protein [Citrobacter freundii]HEB0900081.1 phage tail protein [Citrobacter freundii]